MIPAIKGGYSPDEISRFVVGSVVIRALAQPDGSRRCEIFRCGGWREVTAASARDLALTYPKARTWLRRNYPEML